MNSYLYVRFKNVNSSSILKRLSNLGICIYEIKYDNKDIIIKILPEDYTVITKYIKTSEYKKERYTGIKYLKKAFQKYYLLIVLFFISFLLIIVSSFIITDVKIIHNNSEIVNLIQNELEKHKIKKFTFKKSYNQLTKIKKEIKKDNLDKIEWLEITKKGMKYIVRVEERIIKKEPVNPEYCHIIAKKDGTILGTIIKKGESKVSLNEYVKKGSLLVSGDIFLNEKITDYVCADAKIYAESWYKVNVKVPVKEKKESLTGKKRYNFVLEYNDEKYEILKNRLENYKSTSKKIFDALGVKIYLRLDKQITENIISLNANELEQKAKSLAREKLKLKLAKDDKIISEKVLQKNLNNSTMEMEIFITTKEEIGQRIIARKEENDISNN